MPLVTETVQQTKEVLSSPKQMSSGDKFDVLFVLMIVLLMFAFKNITAFIMKASGVLILILGTYTLLT